MSVSTRRPLEGIRVVDFGQYIAGPAVGMILADQGADVVRIDPPEGPRWNSPTDSILNRGKRRIRVDLKAPTQLDSVIELISRADVSIENFRPGVMERLGLSAQELCRANPALVWLSLPGFSRVDQHLAKIPAWEAVIASAVGQFTDMGLNRVLMGINPSFSPLPMASAYAAVLGSMSVMMALHARRRSSRGDIIEVPLSAALMEGLAYNSMHIENLPDRYKSPRELEIERRRRSGEPLNLSYQELQNFLDPFYRTYTCKDGRPFYVVCSSHIRHPIACLELLDIWDEIRDAGIPTHSPYLDLKDWPEGTDCTIISYPLCKTWARYVAQKMQTAFAARTAYEWEELFGAAGVPGCAVQYTQEWVRSEHAVESRCMLKVDDATYGTMHQPGNICWVVGDAAVADKRSCTTCTDGSEGLESLLGDWFRDIEHSPAAASGPAENSWLEDIRILDLTNIIAGPTAASTLARFGADIIKVDPPNPTFDPWNTIVFGIQGNRGKRSLLLDLKSGAGKAVLGKLLKDVDVVAINATDSQLDRLGLTIEELHRINPMLILCQIDAFGGPARGPRSDYAGYDDLVQATTGIMARFGGSLQTPEEHAHLGTIDVLCGYSAALAIGIALMKRARDGVGGVVRTSLAAAGQLLQIPFMYDYDGRAPFDEPSGRDAKGIDALYRCYEASDGWFFLAVDRKRKLNDFLNAVRVPALEGVEDRVLARRLEQLFRARPVEHWQNVLSAADAGCHPMDSLGQVRERSLLNDSEDVALKLKEAGNFAFIRHEGHPSGHTVDLVAPNSVRPKYGSIAVPGAMPKYGADTVAILGELGYSESHIVELLGTGVVSTSWSDRYLPD